MSARLTRPGPARSTRVFIRPPAPADRDTFLRAVRRSRALHAGWVSPPASPEAYQNYLERISDSSGQNGGFLILRRVSEDLVGVVNLNQIIRARLQSAFLGYYAFVDQAGRGLMLDGLRQVITHAFRRLRLHRLEANIQPGNHASRALVQRCGFRQEGFSPRYLKIGRQWRDHERWAILREDWPTQKLAQANVRPTKTIIPVQLRRTVSSHPTSQHR